MRPDFGELHIYGGIALAAIGAGVAFGIGFGLIVLGVSLVPVGLLIAAGSQPQEAKPRQSIDYDALNTAGGAALREVTE